MGKKVSEEMMMLDINAKEEKSFLSIRRHNRMHMEMEAISQNEGLARTVVAAFIADLNPTIEEMNDVKTAVSEAVTNAVIHGYRNMGGKIGITCVLDDHDLYVEITDRGVGIEDIEKVMQPLFTTGSSLERSGMGFSFMKVFMDDVKVESVIGMGTKVRMKKKIGVIR